MKYFVILMLLYTAMACKHVTEKDDELYSRHLQRRVKLTIIHTPLPSDKSELSLLILNDGQETDSLRVKETMDSLYRKGSIGPLVVVAVHAGDRMQEYGIAGKPDYLQRGARASYYDAFITDELYPYSKKMSGVRKFNSVVIAGCSLGGLSAFDIAWNHPDKIDKAGVFSGAFWWRDKALEDSSYSDEMNRIAYAKLKASRKKPKQQYWFYAGAREETSDRDKDGIPDVIDDTQDIIRLLRRRDLTGPDDITFLVSKEGAHDYRAWASEFPEFLVWGFGRHP